VTAFETPIGLYEMPTFRDQSGELVVKLLVKEPTFQERRRRPGETIDMPLSLLKKDGDGNPIMPAWALPHEDRFKRAIACKPDFAAERFAAAAIASSGSAGYARRKNSFNSVMAGESRVEGSASTAVPDQQQGRAVDLPVPHDFTGKDSK